MGVFNFSKDNDNILTITMDMTGPVNAMNDEYETLMTEAVERLEAEVDSLKGVILTSAKSTFFAGGDLKSLVAVEKDSVDAFFQSNLRVKDLLRRLEKLGKPVVAAINGAALGGGYEICLACHHRIALDSPKTLLGLPEVTLGLLPGAGGVVRLTSLLGAEKAFPFLLQGRKLRPQQALAAGLIDEVAADQEAMLAQARDWIQANPEVQQPWDQKGFRIPGGNLKNPKVMQLVQGAIPMLFKETKGILPAPKLILDTVAATLRHDFDTATRVEARNLCQLVLTPEAKNIISTFFFQLNKLNGGASRPADIERSKVSKLGVIGAGMMGQGIAYAAAKVGIEVVLQDVTQEAADRGKAYSEQLVSKAVAKGKMDQASADALLGRICASADAASLAGCDYIIEAVFEDTELKTQVLNTHQSSLTETGIWGSNTSSLPISLLAKEAQHPERFIGIHFFSPVDKMPLVEIITGEHTSPETLAKTFDLVQQLKKIPIVVNDSRGFFTSRVFSTFIDEGAKLLREGVAPVLIESLARQVGMPVGPLAVHDEVSQKLTLKIAETNQALDRTLDQPATTSEVALEENAKLLKAQGREGRAYGGGYYDYHEDGSKTLWSGIAEHWPTAEDCPVPKQDIKDRIIFRQVLESIRCLEEGVLDAVADGNIGSVMGIGFPQHLGGVFQHINTYGISAFLARTEALQAAYGDDFSAPDLLRQKAAANELFS